jgi:predicted nucleotidyltransferase/HEPN domain-containing protein
MRTSLDALPPKKQQQLATLVELIRSEVDVEMIILFGSHARGDWVQDPVGGYFSDFDVLVVTEKSAAVERHKLWSKIEDRAERFLQPATLSLIVHDIEDVNQQLERGFYFFSDVKQEGIMLYDSQRFTLADAKQLSPQERRDYAKDCFAHWHESAGHFYDHFEFDVERERFAIAAFELHQATERYYHTVLLVFTAYKPKTHNLETLGKRCADLHPALRGVFPQNTAEETRLFKLLKTAYVDARYKTSYTVSKQELEIMASWVRELSARVQRVCREHIEELGRAVEHVDA